MQLKVKGNRTIATVMALFAYLVVAKMQGVEPDPMVVDTLIGGAFLFTRLGMKNGAKAKK